MNKTHPSQKELINIFKSEIEQIDQMFNEISNNIHNKVLPTVVALKLKVETNAKATQNNSPILHEVFNEHSTLQMLSNDLSAICNTLCPSFQGRYGIIASLKTQASVTALLHNTTISTDVVPPSDNTAFSAIDKHHVFVVHENILQILFCQCKTPLRITFIVTSNALNIEYKRPTLEATTYQDYSEKFNLQERLNRVKARLFILNGNWGVKTDWSNYVKIIIPLSNF